jgi:hypothetical protein
MQPTIHAMRKEPHPSRRGFLQRAAGIGIASAAGIALLPRRSWARFRYVPYYDPIDDVRSLNFLLQVERLEAAFYAANAQQPYLVGGLGVSTLQSLIEEIRSHEDAHVALLEQTLGGKADPALNYQGLGVDSVDQFLAMALVFEDVGVSAYLGAIPMIHDSGLVAMAADLSAVEARHAGGLRAYRKGTNAASFGDPEATLTEKGENVNRTRTRDEVMSVAAPFIAAPPA